MTELNTENVDRIFADCMFRSHEEYEECKKEGLHFFCAFYSEYQRKCRIPYGTYRKAPAGNQRNVVAIT